VASVVKEASWCARRLSVRKSQTTVRVGWLLHYAGHLTGPEGPVYSAVVTLKGK
jgi:hypothetical protein